MITVEKARSIVKITVQPGKKTRKSWVKEAAGFVLAEDIHSPIDMPPFRQSAMDGYALNIHRNTTYKIVGEVKAGDGHHPVLKPGEAVRIFTGAAVPDSANTVVIQEKVTADGPVLKLNHPVSENENIRPRGEQNRKGGLALSANTLLSPAGVGYLTMLGIEKVKVFLKPKVAVVITGSELVAPGRPLAYGKIYESNATMLESALAYHGFPEAKKYKVADHYEATLETLDKAIRNNDVVLISGGISVGDYDFVGKALTELGTKQHFYKVKQKPGKPLFFGTKDEIPVFALPGNPASALSSFYIYVLPSLHKMAGNPHFTLKERWMSSTSTYIKKGGRAQFLKAFAGDDVVTILEGQSSSMLHSFAMANAFVYVPAEHHLIEKGDRVKVILLPR